MSVYSPKVEGEAKSVVVGEQNTIYNYNYYREKPKADISRSDKSTSLKKLPCPYRGLYHFEPKDAELFFGRETFVSELFQSTLTRRFIPVLGASGSGKSSVVLAGLVPKLQQKGNWQFTHFRPGSEPFLALAQALIPLYQPHLDATDRMCQARKLARSFEKSEKEDDFIPLRDVFAEIERNHPNQRVLLIADQFEELYTLCPDETVRRKFLDLLLDSFGSNPQGLKFLPTLVTTMRADFLGNALAYRPFADILRGADIKLGAMNREELSQVIIQPAATLGVTLKQGLVERILTDVEDEPGNLALLEFALTELWREKTDNKLTHQGYEKIGQVRGALAKYAEEEYQQLTEAKQKQAQQIFVRLVRLGENNHDTRRRVNRNQLGEANWELVTGREGLADSRLVVTSLAEDEARETIEIVHEALIRHWQRLRQWIDTSREQLKQQHKLEDEAQQWQNSEYKLDYLLSKKRLKEAKEFQQEQQEQYPLSELAHNFIDKSIKQQKRERIKAWGLFAVIPLIGTLVGVNSVVTERNKEIKLRSDKNSIEKCEGEKHCSGRIAAIKRLVRGGQNLRYSNFNDAELNHAYFASGELHSAKFVNAKLNDATFMSADLRFADLSNTELNQAEFNDADLDYANFSGAKLNRANFIFSELDSIDLSHADLSNAILNYTDLRHANLSNADFAGASLHTANLSEARLYNVKNLEPSQIKSACYWDEAYYKARYDREQKRWFLDEEDNQQYIEQLKQDKDSDPSNLVPGCVGWWKSWSRIWEEISYNLP